MMDVSLSLHSNITDRWTSPAWEPRNWQSTWDSRPRPGNGCQHLQGRGCSDGHHLDSRRGSWTEWSQWTGWSPARTKSSLPRILVIGNTYTTSVHNIYVIGKRTQHIGDWQAYTTLAKRTQGSPVQHGVNLLVAQVHWQKLAKFLEREQAVAHRHELPS